MTDTGLFSPYASPMWCRYQAICRHCLLLTLLSSILYILFSNQSIYSKYSTSSTLTSSVRERRGPFFERRYPSAFYLKTHKTGSTTVAHQLLSYARRHGLTTLSAPGNVYIRVKNPNKGRVDAIVSHHVAFSWDIIHTYLHMTPTLRLTSIRLPLQRQLSWFRQQNRQHENMHLEGCDMKNDTLLAAYDEWRGNRSASQWNTLQESSSRERLQNNVTAILEQFTFVLVKEVMKESLECLCEEVAVRLCNEEEPLLRKNVKQKGSCVEKQLLQYRAEELMRGDEKDLILYEEAMNRVTDCQRKGISEECRCPEKVLN